MLSDRTGRSALKRTLRRFCKRSVSHINRQPVGIESSNPVLSASQSLSLAIARPNYRKARAGALICKHVVAEKATVPLEDAQGGSDAAASKLGNVSLSFVQHASGDFVPNARQPRPAGATLGTRNSSASIRFLARPCSWVRSPDEIAGLSCAATSTASPGVPVGKSSRSHQRSPCSSGADLVNLMLYNTLLSV